MKFLSGEISLSQRYSDLDIFLRTSSVHPMRMSVRRVLIGGSPVHVTTNKRYPVVTILMLPWKCKTILRLLMSHSNKFHIVFCTQYSHSTIVTPSPPLPENVANKVRHWSKTYSLNYLEPLQTGAGSSVYVCNVSIKKWDQQFSVG